MCKDYRYHASADCIATTESAGYEIHDRERVVIYPPPPVDLNWTLASPPIVFGTVSTSVIQQPSTLEGAASEIAPACSGWNPGSSN